MATNNQ